MRTLYFLAVLGAAVIGVTLWSWGQPLICTCGYVKLWVGLIWDEGNSQHIADWYTLSHILHGVLIILVGRLFGGRVGFPVLFAAAIATGVGWEVLEHTDWVLGQFRGQTIYQGYVGDSVLNSVMDYVWMWVGFFAAHALATRWILVLILALEVTAGVFGRDNLTFATLQLLVPVEMIRDYQQAIHPDGGPPG